MKKLFHAFAALLVVLSSFSPLGIATPTAQAVDVEPVACTSLTVTVGSDVQTVDFASLPTTLTYAPNGRTLTISDLGGGNYKVVYDVTAGAILTMRQIDASISLNGPATFSALNTSYPGINGLETFPGPLGSDDVDLTTPTAIDLSLRTTKNSKDTFGFTVANTDSDGDGVIDCSDICVDNAYETEDGAPETYNDVCTKTSDANVCGETATTEGVIACDSTCTASEPVIPVAVDTDSDGTADCVETCDEDPAKLEPGTCGCGISDTDSDEDGVADCNDNCVDVANADQADLDENGVGNVCEPAPACGTVSVDVVGEGNINIASFPRTHTYSNGRKLIITDIGGGDYKVVYDVTYGNIGQFKKIQGTIIVNNGGTLTLDTSYPLPAGLETFGGPLGGDSAGLGSSTVINFNLRTLKASKDTFGYNLDLDADDDGVADCTDNCVENSNADQVDTDEDTIGDVCDAPDCGNAVTEGEEMCDMGEGNTDTACSAAYGETCKYCSTSCAIVEVTGASCGDGTIQESEGEQCDDGNITNEDGCSATCQTESTGGDGDGDGDVCTDETSSTIQVPGTTSTTTPVQAGTVAVGDLLTISAAGTWAAGNDDPCTRTSDANGIDADHECFGTFGMNGDFPYGALVGRIDGGNWFLVGTMFSTTVTEAGTLELAYRDSSYDDNSGEVSATITVETEVACVCGDGSINNTEQCDDGNGIDNDECTNECTTPRCGDYIIQEGEECENSMMYSKVSESMGYCNASCEWVEIEETYCGNEVVEEGEECDDGNETDTDACSNECTSNGSGGGQASSIGGGSSVGPSSLLETGPEEEAAAVEDTAGTPLSDAVDEVDSSTIAACNEDDYILSRLEKLSKQANTIVYDVPAEYATVLGGKLIRSSSQLLAKLRGEKDTEKRNEIIRAFVCKIEIIKAARGLRHEHIGANSGGDKIDYLLQYLQDLAILQFVK